jgi:hypothetical protein
VSEAKVTLREAFDAAVAASRYLEWPRRDPARALGIITPYAECKGFADAPPGVTPGIRAIVCAVLGDCYRELREAEAAAGWYARARGYTKANGDAPFFAPYYAAMVVDSRLAGHYSAALECVRAHHAAWRARPLLVRMYWHVVSMWWLRPSQWKMRARERRLLGELEALVREGGGA